MAKWTAYVKGTKVSDDEFNDAEKELLEKEGEGLITFKKVFEKTTPAQRAEYFKDSPMGEQFAGVFPNASEAYMNGEGIGGSVKAGLRDLGSLKGRFEASQMGNFDDNVTGIVPFWARLQGDKNERSKYWQDLGTRSEETDNPIGQITRDPINGVINAATGYLGSLPKYAAEGGKFLLKSAPRFGKWAGRALGGAAEGAAIEAADSFINEREYSGKKAASGAAFGAVGEVVGGAIEKLLQNNAEELLISLASAAWLGNTDRKMTKAEFWERMKDPNFRRVVEELAEKQISKNNVVPFLSSKDRGKNLQDDVDNAQAQANAILAKDRVMNLSLRKDIKNGETATMANDARKEQILRQHPDDVETYAPKTIYREPGNVAKDAEYEHTIGETERFNGPISNKSHNTVQQTNQEYQLNRYAGKYDDVSLSVGKAGLREGDMSKDEAEFLDKLLAESQYDMAIIAKMNPVSAVATDKFLGNKNPFTNEFMENVVVPFLEKHNKEGFSKEFKDRVNEITGQNIAEGRKTISRIWNALDKDRPGIERAFAYAKSQPHNVKKGFTDAVDQFADELSAYAEMRTGQSGINAEGKPYIVGKENMKKYAFSYLAKVQEILEKQYALSPSDITTLYGLATNVNDTTVQKAIINMLRKLGVDKGTIADFEKVGGRYAMLNKARQRMKNNSTEDNAFKGTIVAPIVPQEGINLPNALSYSLTSPKVNAQAGKFEYGPNGHSGLARNGLYLLGVHTGNRLVDNKEQK